MGEDGAKLTQDSITAAEHLVEAFEPLGEITSKKMFGGHGIFGDGVMFAIVDSSGRGHLRVDESTRGAYEAAGAQQHSRMPYWSIPAQVSADEADLLDWAGKAMAVAHATKK